MLPNEQSPRPAETDEQKAHKADLRRVVLYNLAVILLLVGLYFVNKKVGFVDRLAQYF